MHTPLKSSTDDEAAQRAHTSTKHTTSSNWLTTLVTETKHLFWPEAHAE